MGDSLAYHLEGLQAELNKVLADYGDAINSGSHPSVGISDFQQGSKSPGVIVIPRNGALNMGHTRPGGTPPKIHTFPSPSVPPQTGEFADRILASAEAVAGLTPAARGTTQGANKSGLAIALEMLPTTNIVDWERSHWSQAIGGGGGINEIVAVIFWHKGKVTSFAPKIDSSMFGLQQNIVFKPVVPRDRIEIIDEVVRLATAKAVSPQEWLRRLGDIKDIDEEWDRLKNFLAGMAAIEAAVAGRGVTVTTPSNPEQMPRVKPQLDAQPTPASKQPATQPEGQKSGTNTASSS